MEHFKRFLIRLQTFNINIITRKKNDDTYPHNLREMEIYDLSHENRDINWAFKSEIKELTELAVTDLLNLPPAQITLQLRRLESIKNLFQKFFENYYRFNGPVNNDTERKAYFFSLNLDDIFIVPNISPEDSVVVTQHFLDDLYDSVRAREEYLKDFEKAVTQVLHSDKVQQSQISSNVRESEDEAPVIKEHVIPEFYAILKDYFIPEEQDKLLKLLQSGKSDVAALTFNGNGNRLADAFKKLFDTYLIVGCNKSGLESWILKHFRYSNNGQAKNYTEKYLNDIISSDIKNCQSPILEIEKSANGQFTVVPAQRIKKNSKKW